jgi:hypothetical protein
MARGAAGGPTGVAMDVPADQGEGSPAPASLVRLNPLSVRRYGLPMPESLPRFTGNVLFTGTHCKLLPASLNVINVTIEPYRRSGTFSE